MDPDAYSKPMRQRVDEVLKTIANMMDKAPGKTSTDAQGIDINIELLLQLCGKI